MRPAILSAFIRMMPRLRARESREAIRQISAGNGIMPREEWREYDNQLRTDENFGERQRAIVPNRAQLASIGIRVVTHGE